MLSTEAVCGGAGGMTQAPPAELRVSCCLLLRVLLLLFVPPSLLLCLILLVPQLPLQLLHFFLQLLYCSAVCLLQSAGALSRAGLSCSRLRLLLLSAGFQLPGQLRCTFVLCFQSGLQVAALLCRLVLMRFAESCQPAVVSLHG